jgi:UPF0755 protein
MKIRKKRKWLLRGLLVLLLIGSTGAGMGYYYLFHPNTTVCDKGIFFIPPKSSLQQVVDTLQSRGYIKNTTTLLCVAQLKKYDRYVKSGRYRLRDGMNNNEVINLLRAGIQAPVSFTFNNIRTLEELAAVIARQLPITSSEFLSRVNDPERAEALGFTPSTILAMFIPNTYEMYWNTNAVEFLQRMHREYRRFWNEQRMARATEMGMNPVEVSTLASIIEEESTKRDEFPVIAGVYVNRLKCGMKLDACPTIKFILGDFTLSRVLDKHVKIDHPYNTYRHSGLPPGPIRIASIQVIDSVLNYQKHDYLFFCAKSDFSGYHHFSRTLRQHNAHAQEYHKELDKRKIWK